MERADKNLTFLLQYENVAWYEKGTVRILDRRIYPVRTEYVVCKTHNDVANAIREMVTQSYGPYVAAAMGMALAAYEARNKNRHELMKYLEDASYILSHARPTTTVNMKKVMKRALGVARDALEAGKPVDQAIFDDAIKSTDEFYNRALKSAKHLVDVIPPNATIMTQCFAETTISMVFKECRLRGNEIKVICPETRPYFQGSRLTASLAYDMGFDVTVISDNMPAYTLKKKNVALFTSGADVICMDGHIVNKVGTFQIALAANYLRIPYFCIGTPNPEHPTIDTVTIEERNGNDVLHAMGIQTTKPGVKGYYPAFDITPPNLCNGVVTDKGIFSAYCLKSYYNGS